MPSQKRHLQQAVSFLPCYINKEHTSFQQVIAFWSTHIHSFPRKIQYGKDLFIICFIIVIFI